MLYVKPDYGNDYSGHLGDEKVPSFCAVLRFPFFQTQGYIFYLFALMACFILKISNAKVASPVTISPM